MMHPNHPEGSAWMIGDAAEFDLREQLTRIDRAIAETEKLQEESRKYAAETRRLNREDRYFPLASDCIEQRDRCADRSAGRALALKGM